MSKDQEPILITGAARSGTSMVAAAVHFCGAWGGTMSGPTRWNAKGMFENADIRNKIIKPYLSWAGLDPLGQHPLPDVTRLKPLSGLRARVRKIINGQGYAGGPWMYKGAKMCLLWPLWHKAFSTAKWVIVRRADDDVVQSCLKTSFMRAYKTAAGWEQWVNEHKRRFEEMEDAGLEVFQIWPSRMVNGDFGEAKAMVQWLGLEWNEQSVRQFVSPELWHGEAEAVSGQVCCGAGI